ncbi:MAG TPA: DUF4833 domain-containing protein [Thermodesulfobacteriota bacterium]|nr:DUF4833 domain-containing protein [Thermodesulfobacteriota bacterium]
MKLTVLRSGIFLLLSIFFVILATAPIAYGSQPLSQSLETRHLFKIERSKNANIVQYDVQVTPDGKLYQKEPVIVYWIRLAEDGRKRELNFIQRQLSYGIRTKYDPVNNSAIVEIAAARSRAIKVYEVGGVYRGETRINGQPAFIERIFVTSIKNGLFRKTNFIELFGKDIKTGLDCYEKLTP